MAICKAWLEGFCGNPAVEENKVSALNDASDGIQQGAPKMETPATLLLEQLSKVSQVGAWEFNITSQLFFWNEKARDIHDVDDAFTPTLDKVLSFYPAETGQLLQDVMTRCIETKSEWDLELPFVTHTKLKRWVRITGAPYLENGNVVSLLGSIQDISDQKVKDRIYRRSESVQKALLNSLNEGVLAFDNDGIIRSANRAALRSLKMDSGSVVGTNVANLKLTFLHEDGSERSGDDNAFFAALQWPDVINDHVIQVKRSDDQVLHLKLNAEAIRTDGDATKLGVVVSFSDVTKERKNAEKILHAAHHDALTGLANRAKFMSALRKILSSSSSERTNWALMLLDLDHFKPVNDTYGHNVGDVLLKLVGERLSESAREGDLLVRLGGDEFAILTRNESNHRDDLVARATKLISILSAPYELQENRIQIGVSIGITTVPPEPISREDLIGEADSALYKAKSDGRNGFSFFEAELKSVLSRRLQLELKLARAIADDQLEMSYVSFRSLESDDEIGRIATPLWRDMSGELVPTLPYLGNIDSINALTDIGRWMFERAFQDATEWPEEISLVLDVADRQMGTGHFVETFINCLGESSFNAGRVVLQFSENIFHASNPAVSQELYQLRLLGIQLAIREFGSDVASLKTLRDPQIRFVQLAQQISSTATDANCGFIRSCSEAVTNSNTQLIISSPNNIEAIEKALSESNKATSDGSASEDQTKDIESKAQNNAEEIGEEKTTTNFAGKMKLLLGRGQ